MGPSSPPRDDVAWNSERATNKLAPPVSDPRHSRHPPSPLFLLYTHPSLNQSHACRLFEVFSAAQAEQEISCLRCVSSRSSRSRPPPLPRTKKTQPMTQLQNALGRW